MDKKRWVVLIACCFINLVLGSIYAWSVFSSAMAGYFNNSLGLSVTAGDLALVYTIANSVGPITMITGGWFNDHMGPKRVILVGGIMWGLGMFLSGFATSVGFLIVTYGIIGGLGLGMAYGSTVSTCVKFFPDKRGLIGGITTAVYGMSSVILPPIVTAIVDKTSAPFAFKAVGVAFIVLIIISVLFVEQCPQDYKPAGWNPPVKAAFNREQKDWKGMIKTPEFYVMLFLLTCGAFSGMMITSQASSVAQSMVGMTPAAAAIAVSVIALFNAFGRIFAGFLSDKLGRINALSIACVLSIVGLACLFLSSDSQSVALFYVGVSVVGISYGSFMGVYPGFTADQYGPKNNSVNYGIMFIGFAIAGYFGPQIMRNTFASTGEYKTAFMYAICFAVIGLVFTFLFRLVTRRKSSN
ncbi:OFA family MFS transporter [Lachnospira multipara]|uniref:L-lactate MFS transporter n=1 Tax=Lachnospira multipara TaxID=28051 RepID=UPI0004E1EA29|nr:OFA family MFS transporter [Lachnospira multipara]